MPDKILVIPFHDNDTLKLLELCLANFGYVPIVLPSDMETITIKSIFLTHQPKVVIALFDAKYTGPSGLAHQICEMIRSNPHTMSVGIIFLVGKDNEFVRYGGYGKEPCYVNEYLTIPFSLIELKQKLHRLVANCSE
jgi:DNA-binding response OmpR family regulator